MSSLASRLLGGELLTLPEFAHEVITRLGYDTPLAAATQPRPGIVAVSTAGKAPVDFNVQSYYRAYQKDPRAKDEIVKRLVRWIEASC